MKRKNYQIVIATSILFITLFFSTLPSQYCHPVFGFEFMDAWDYIVDYPVGGLSQTVKQETPEVHFRKEKRNKISEFTRGNPYCMMLDFGTYTEYVGKFKSMGLIPQDYRLPKTYWKVIDPVKCITDCDQINAKNYIDKNGVGGFETLRYYTPKYLLEQSQTAAPQQAPVQDDGRFDAEFYARTYPDVVAVLGTDPVALKNHYDTCGKAEGRKAHP